MSLILIWIAGVATAPALLAGPADGTPQVNWQKLAVEVDSADSLQKRFDAMRELVRLAPPEAVLDLQAVARNTNDAELREAAMPAFKQIQKKSPGRRLLFISEVTELATRLG